MTRSKMSIPTRSKTVLGIDPGFDRIGAAILDENKVLYSCCIETDRGRLHAERLFEIGMAIKKIIKKWNPAALAIESLFLIAIHISNRRSACKSPRSVSMQQE